MGMYYCHECGSLKDGDYNVPTESPYDDCELVCEDCIVELEERMEDEVNGEDYVKPRVSFDKRQRFDSETGILV